MNMWIDGAGVDSASGQFIQVTDPTAEEVRADSIWINDPLTDNMLVPSAG